MELTAELVAPFVGGQIEIKNMDGKYLFRGQIATIDVANQAFVVTLDWMAENIEFPSGVQWVKDDNLTYEVFIRLHSIRIDEGHLTIVFPSIRELVTLFMQDESTLNSSVVEGS